KNIGPPEDAGAPVDGSAGCGGGEVCERGRVSKERVRRQEARTREKDAGRTGSLVEMYSTKWVWLPGFGPLERELAAEPGPEEAVPRDFGSSPSPEVSLPEDA